MPNQDTQSKDETTQELEVDQVYTESHDEIRLILNGNEYITDISTANGLINDLQDVKTKSKGIPAYALKIARCDSKSLGVDDNPYHLRSDEFGCQHSTNADEQMKSLNLYQRTFEPGTRETSQIGGLGTESKWVENHREEHQRDTPMDAETYIDIFMCNQCAKPVKHWYKQRRIFLPQLAKGLPLDEITEDTLTNYDAFQGACDICATPQSGIAELSRGEVQKGDIEAPYLLCPTCKDHLIHAESEINIDKLPQRKHPNKTPHIIPRQPITDPSFRPTKSEDSRIPDTLKDMDIDEFIDTVSEFYNVNEWTAKQLYQKGYQSVPDLANADKKALKEITLIGDGIATSIIKESTKFIKQKQNRDS